VFFLSGGRLKKGAVHINSLWQDDSYQQRHAPQTTKALSGYAAF